MKSASEWVKQLPPDVLDNPMPLPARLDYALGIIKRIQDDAVESERRSLSAAVASIESDAKQCELEAAKLNTTGDKLNGYLMSTQAMAHRLDLQRIKNARPAVECDHANTTKYPSGERVCNKCGRLLYA